VNSVTPGQVVNLELYAVVTGAAGNSALEGFQDGYLSVLSSNGGNIRGTLSGTLQSPFAASASQNGLSQDLDGDGDSDLGSNATAASNAFLFARAGTLQTSGVSITNGQEFKLATLTFTVTSIINPADQTFINLAVRVTDFTGIDLEAVWQQDGNGSSSTNLDPGGTFPNSFPLAGTAVSIRAIPEPGAAALLPLGAMLCAAWRRRPPHLRR
jgi:hypothetical protein